MHGAFCGVARPAADHELLEGEKKERRPEGEDAIDILRNRPKKRLLLIFSCILLLGVLPGCWDKRELDQYAFVLSMGIDLGEHDEIELSVRIAIPSGMAQQGGAGRASSPAEVSKVITVTGRTTPEAMAHLDSQVERQVSYMHCRTVLIGESLARQGIAPYLDVFNRYREFRRSLFLFIIKDVPVRDIFMNTTPVLEYNVARYLESIVVSMERTDYAPVTRLLDINRTLEQHNVDSVMTVFTLNPQILKEKQDTKVKPRPTPEFRRDDPDPEAGQPETDPGKLHRSGGNPLEYIGAAVLVSGKLVAYMDGEETRIWSMLVGRYTTGLWTFPDPSQPGKYISLRLNRGDPIEVTVDDSVRPIRIMVKAELDGTVVEVSSRKPYITPEGFREMERMADKDLNDRALRLVKRMQKIPADPFLFVRTLRMRTLTAREYWRIPWHDWYEEAEFIPVIHVEVRRPGYQIQPGEPAGKEERLVK
ncbi:Ger(x)C family spore germination protein [Heliomicrobium undosum]|uniref:Ger(x)C family spore germination protein n=1 Tax=Heliomicrobium undosum TaxID=121734 RepID=UPI002E2832DF|nr:Ger(x)C family spore germination protein [Heliomicrobium undosum]